MLKNCFLFTSIILTGLLSVYSQSANITVGKGSIVVPKFILKWTDLEDSWRGFLKGQLLVERNSNGKITVNNNENWEGVPFFPASELEGDSLKAKLYKSEYSRPSIVAYKVENIDRKKDFTEVKLSKLNDRMVDIQLRFANSNKDFDNTFQEVFFIGNLEEFGKSSYFSETVLPKLLKGKVDKLSRDEKLELMKNVQYDVNSLRLFKEKIYLASSYKDPKDTEYNSNLVNESERVVRTIQKYLPEIKKKAKIALSVKEIEGIKIETTIPSRVFGATPFSGQDSSRSYDSFEFYAPIDALKQFIEAEITDQELVDKSFVLLNGSRIKVVLSQFSN